MAFFWKNKMNPVEKMQTIGFSQEKREGRQNYEDWMEGKKWNIEFHSALILYQKSEIKKDPKFYF